MTSTKRSPVDLDPLRSAEVQAEVNRQDRQERTLDAEADLRRVIEKELVERRHHHSVSRALHRVATAASALLLSMDVDEAMGVGAFNEERDGLREALRDFDSCKKVELENRPQAKELDAEKAAEGRPCPECHATKIVWRREVLPRGGPVRVTCPRCKGSGRIDPFDFGIPTAQVARGRDAS